MMDNNVERLNWAPVLYCNERASADARDATALLFFSSALQNTKYKTMSSPVILNSVPTGKPATLIGNKFSDFITDEKVGLLVLPTRPCMQDNPTDTKKIYRSYTWLENKIFASLQRILPYCTRGQICTESLGIFRFTIFHKNNRNDRMASLNEKNKKNITCWFLVYIDKLKVLNDCSLLSAFGLSSQDTLRFHWALSHHPKFTSLVNNLITGNEIEDCSDKDCSNKNCRIMVIEMTKDDDAPGTSIFSLDNLNTIEVTTCRTHCFNNTFDPNQNFIYSFF